jgi:pimeloyl-ACP methyl ester carboxylesterase
MAPAGFEPFTVRVPNAVLDDLHRRLDDTRWPVLIDGIGWEQGTDIDYLRELVSYWRNGYDWRAAEARLNSMPQYLTSFEAQQIHLLHVQSPHEGAIPLVIHHGWPGSVVEFLDIVGPLTRPESHGGSAEQAFHVVCPSLPGYGFSGPTTERGWTPQRMAEAAADLMDRLGYERYCAQGGDWGSMVTSQLGALHPDRVIGIHLNMVPAAPPRENPNAGLSDQELADVEAMRARGQDEYGYQRIQRTRPQSLSVGLNDSPAGLAAWIVEKFRAWSDCDGDIESSFTKDQLLTNVMIYWVTGTIASANRLYYESHEGAAGTTLPAGPIDVPMAYARFPGDGLRPPRPWVERKYDVRRWTDMDRGGHFAAMEEPDLLVDDIRTFFSDLR